ncbi:MAG TPA: transglutaminase-like domain-containing protein [Actinomycetota bacterium]|nr:transglutaminase-like domain-containing protein [Actinomycetota bacterium]
MDAIERFAEIVAEEDFPLADAFLAFARAEYPEMDTDRYLEAIRELGTQVCALAAGTQDPVEQLKAVRDVMTAAGIRGDREEYYDPRNSFLNEVIDRGRGIPITLSTLWIESARWAGIDLAGIGMPMHFLVGVSGEEAYADPFDGGRVLDVDQAMLVFARRTAGRIEWHDSYLEPARPRDIVRRALVNLKSVFGAAGELSRALWVEDFLLVLPDTPPDEHRERAAVLAAMGRWPEAIADLRDYLDEAESPEVEEVEREIRRLQATMN